jgi:hypothetical protein
MKLKIIKNKFGELAGSPIFEEGKVIFPTFTNPDVAREDEEWEVELIRLIPLNKVDKKGQPMFKGIFVLKRLPIFMLIKRGDRWLTYESYNIKNVIIKGENVEVIFEDGRVFNYNKKGFFKIEEEEEVKEIEVSLNDLASRFKFYTEAEKEEMLKNLQWEKVFVAKGNADDVYFRTGGHFVSNLRLKILYWSPEEEYFADSGSNFTYKAIIDNLPLFSNYLSSEIYLAHLVSSVLKKSEVLKEEYYDHFTEIVEAIDPLNQKHQFIFVKIKKEKQQ